MPVRWKMWLWASVALLGCLQASPSFAQLKALPGEWPGWRGPDRDGLSPEKGLLKQWPEGGPKMLWKITELGAGFSTPSVAQGKIFVMGTKGKDEYIIALDFTDGKRLWDSKIGTLAGGHPGPRCTPTVDGDKLYALSSDGKLVCAATASGEVVWKKDLKADFGGKTGSWAYAESPLIDGDTLICTPGGDKATMLALNKVTGATIWQGAVTSLDGVKKNFGTAGYSSAIVANLHGKKQYLQFLSGGVVGVDAQTGKFLWHYDKPANGTANCSTPLVHGNSVFAASNYGVGGGLASIKKDGDSFTAEEDYFVKAMQNHHGGMILVGDHLYGTGAQTLICLEIKTGKIAWQERGVGKGSIFYADGLLFHRSENGPVALVEATPTGYVEKGRFSQPDRSEKKAWPHPVVVGGRLLLRDQDVLLCYDVKAVN